MRCLRLDYYLPGYNFVERHEICVNSSSERVFEAIQNLDLSASRVARILFGLRNAEGIIGNRMSFRRGKERLAPLELSLEGLVTKTGFIYLEAVDNKEVIVGLIGKFWTPTVGILKGLRAQEFEDFNRAGYAKTAANFYIEQKTDGSLALSTETRILCLGPKAKIKFSIYWMIIRPFSGWLRLIMLGLVKKQAESKSAGWNLEKDKSRR